MGSGLLQHNCAFSIVTRSEVYRPCNYSGNMCDPYFDSVLSVVTCWLSLHMDQCCYLWPLTLSSPSQRSCDTCRCWKGHHVGSSQCSREKPDTLFDGSAALWPVLITNCFLGPNEINSKVLAEQEGPRDDDKEEAICHLHRDASKTQNRMIFSFLPHCTMWQHKCISVHICKDLHGADSMHLNTGQEHPLHITVHPSNHCDKLQKVLAFFVLFKSKRNIMTGYNFMWIM